MIRLHKDIVNVIHLLKTAEKEEKQKILGDNYKETDCEGLTLITTLVTSCVRYLICKSYYFHNFYLLLVWCFIFLNLLFPSGLRFSTSKLQVLEILYQLSRHTAEETILDRILPYIVNIYKNRIIRINLILNLIYF